MDRSTRLVIAVVVVGFAVNTLRLGVHKVSEGYVGVYWRAGKLLDSVGVRSTFFEKFQLTHT